MDFSDSDASDQIFPVVNLSDSGASDLRDFLDQDL